MSPPLILAIDNDALLLDLLEHKFATAGFRVLTAMDCEEALTIMEKHRPNIIILDVIMSSIDGFELLRRLKADPATKGIHIVMLTALDREEDILNAFKLGVSDYLVKPFIPDELILRVLRLAPAGVDA